jgi:hypothetical protein
MRSSLVLASGSHHSLLLLLLLLFAGLLLPLACVSFLRSLYCLPLGSSLLACRFHRFCTVLLCLLCLLRMLCLLLLAGALLLICLALARRDDRLKRSLPIPAGLPATLKMSMCMACVR